MKQIFFVFLVLLVIAMLLIMATCIFYLTNIINDTRMDIQDMKRQLDESKAFREEIRQFLDRLGIDEFKTTAYSPHDDRNGLNSWRPKLASRSYSPRTRTGTIPRPGTAAVDPKVIPLGTKLWVEGYGFARAEDTGELVKGKHIDLYVPNFDEAVKYGKQRKKVMWLEGNDD
ncbi:MAG: 3D domain-containing protein [Peptococcaceae bacterium]|jgi:3D (Asp-Asp-Asp) domain-containing protein|nr:3D domain-containing protein [Peptococcaceae bacterium]MDH7525258.1 3D domain-containing protein [Peptococcaceae bacterium]